MFSASRTLRSLSCSSCTKAAVSSVQTARCQKQAAATVHAGLTPCLAQDRSLCFSLPRSWLLRPPREAASGADPPPDQGGSCSHQVLTMRLGSDDRSSLGVYQCLFYFFFSRPPCATVLLLERQEAGFRAVPWFARDHRGVQV